MRGPRFQTDERYLGCSAGSVAAVGGRVERFRPGDAVFGDLSSFGFGGGVWRKQTREFVTVTLTFRPEIEAGLLAKAQARGMALQEYLQTIVEQDALPPAQATELPDRTRREEAVRRMLAFGDKYQLSLGEPITRELLHEGHRY
jgi:hypothetical protein